MRHRIIVVAAAAIALAGASSAGLAPAAPASPGVYAEQAYPQTRPNAGQFCKRIHRGVVTRAANGRKVRCTAEGSRSRWRYV